MKQMMKVLSLVLVLVFAFSMAAMAEGKTYVVGTNPEFAPFEYVGDNGEVMGIDIDVINALFAAAEPDATVVIESMAFDALIPSLAAGQVDLVIAGMTANDERRQSVDFTDPYFSAIQAIVVKADNEEITSVEALVGKKIGVQLGTTGDLYVTDNVADVTVERYDKGIDAVQDVINGKLDAVVIDDAPAAAFVNNAGGAVKVSASIATDEVYAIALPKGSDELCAKLNEALKQLTEDGTLAAIMDKYMPAE